MPILARLSQSHRSANWALIYTMEAHASDEWPISSARYEPSRRPVSIPQHRTEGERLQAAQTFQRTFRVPFPVRVDGIENNFETNFCTWPFRFYILYQGRVFWRAQPRGCSYHLEELVRALEDLQKLVNGTQSDKHNL